MKTLEVSVDRWMKKMWYAYMCVYVTNEILFIQEKKEILLFVTTWMDLENIMLIKIHAPDIESQYHMISLMCGS